MRKWQDGKVQLLTIFCVCFRVAIWTWGTLIQSLCESQSQRPLGGQGAAAVSWSAPASWKLMSSSMASPMFHLQKMPLDKCPFCCLSSLPPPNPCCLPSTSIADVWGTAGAERGEVQRHQCDQPIACSENDDLGYVNHCEIPWMQEPGCGIMEEINAYLHIWSIKLYYETLEWKSTTDWLHCVGNMWLCFSFFVVVRKNGIISG